MENFIFSNLVKDVAKIYITTISSVQNKNTGSFPLSPLGKKWHEGIFSEKVSRFQRNKVI